MQGSGFVFKREGSIAYILTNNHVVDPHLESIVQYQRPGTVRRVPVPRSPRGGGGGGGYYYVSPPSIVTRRTVHSLKNASVTVVFSSGTKEEESLTAEVLALDPEQDLAVLKVGGVQNRPSPST